MKSALKKAIRGQQPRPRAHSPIHVQETSSLVCRQPPRRLHSSPSSLCLRRTWGPFPRLYCSFVLSSSAKALTLEPRTLIQVPSAQFQRFSYFSVLHGDPCFLAGAPLFPPGETCLQNGPDLWTLRHQDTVSQTPQVPRSTPVCSLPTKPLHCPKIQNVGIQVIQRGPAHGVHLVRKHTGGDGKTGLTANLETDAFLQNTAT